MNSQGRVFGRNLSYYMNKKGINRAALAKKMGYTEEDIQRIIDGRLFIRLSEKQAFSDELDVPLSDLTDEQKDIPLDQYGCIECRGMFSSDASRNKILDLFDAYCDIQEMIV